MNVIHRRPVTLYPLRDDGNPLFDKLENYFGKTLSGSHQTGGSYLHAVVASLYLESWDFSPPSHTPTNKRSLMWSQVPNAR